MACENDVYVYVGKFVDCSVFAEAANRPYINVLYANSPWCTNSQRIAFGCLPNVRCMAECCLPRLGNMSTSNVRIVFECRIRVFFQCKLGFILTRIRDGPFDTYLIQVCCNNFNNVYTFRADSFRKRTGGPYSSTSARIGWARSLVNTEKFAFDDCLAALAGKGISISGQSAR